MPLLEAMTAGCPVVSSDTGSLPEIYPPEIHSFDPTNQKEIEQTLARALALAPKEKARQIKAGIIKAGEFTWAKTAQLTYAVYRKNI